MKHTRKKGIQINFQYHDEWSKSTLESEKESLRGQVMDAIKETNEELKLNVKIGCSFDVGINYMECH